MAKNRVTFDQLLQKLIAALKYQFPIIRALPITPQYFNDILQLLNQNNLIPERSLQRLQYLTQFINRPEMIDQKTLQVLQELLDYYQVSAAAKDTQTSNESRLSQLFSQLDISSAISVVDGYTELTDLQSYLNVPLPAETILTDLLGTLEGSNRSLTLICGASGTGKSQLLAALRTKKSKLFELPNLHVKDDAGLGNNAEVPMDQRLLRDFHNFSDRGLTAKTTYHQLMTIHTDLLKRFYRLANKLGTYTELVNLIQATKILDNQPRNVITRTIQIIFVDDEPACPLDSISTQNALFDQLTSKIFAANAYKNPFYQAYQADTNQNIHSTLHTNYYILTHPQVLSSIKYLLIKAQLADNAIFSIREILTFLHDIAMPNIGRPPLYNTLFFLMFPPKPQTRILKGLAACDPIVLRNPELAILLGSFHKVSDKSEYVLSALNNHSLPSNWVSDFYSYYVDKPTSDVVHTKLLLRILFLFDHNAQLFTDKTYDFYLNSYLQVQQGYFNEALAKYCYAGLKAWYHAPGSAGANIDLAKQQKINPLNISIYYMSVAQTTITIHLAATDSVGEHHYQFQLTLALFELFYHISKNYVLRPQDRQSVAEFDQFAQALIASLKITENVPNS
ncbi:DNA phosphorothioation-dependent restriction protein DptF [Agrilactobacillus yilanensis]|uniref:DNA phosphorothioation-dependent restriction protein DptF n=1 Tax=Agrilactobacillus yilanensis TaxID=2485997 RepID=A0ABW4J6Y5_9LACO|nr:DNA phosphorothioation-dependent restriction protein DptF [Agrilactobacillus yilanensis]